MARMVAATKTSTSRIALATTCPTMLAPTTSTHWCRSRMGLSTVLSARTTTTWSTTTSSGRRVLIIEFVSTTRSTKNWSASIHRMVKIDLDIVTITTTHKTAIRTPSTEDNIDAMVFEATIDQILLPEVISNTITYILNLRHREVELRSIYADQLKTGID